MATVDSPVWSTTAASTPPRFDYRPRRCATAGNTASGVRTNELDAARIPTMNLFMTRRPKAAPKLGGAPESPRWLSGRFGLGEPRDTLHIEAQFPIATIEGLRRRGHVLIAGATGTNSPGMRTASSSIR